MVKHGTSSESRKRDTTFRGTTRKEQGITDKVYIGNGD